MSQPFFSYHAHIAKLAQVANKQTIFLAHILHNMQFDKNTHQYFVDMSTYRKVQIMKEVSPKIAEDKLLNLANQYLSKLKKAGLIRSISRGMWLVNPSCYGQYRIVSKNLRDENTHVFMTEEFNADGSFRTATFVGNDDKCTGPIEVGTDGEAISIGDNLKE